MGPGKFLADYILLFLTERNYLQGVTKKSAITLCQYW